MQQIYGLHYLRGIAMFFIVLTHTDIFIDRIAQTDVRLFDAFLWEWTAIFFLISGFLFQLSLPRYRAKDFFTSKFKRILVPYVLISIPAIFLYVAGFKDDHNWIDMTAFREHSVAYQVLFLYATGAHLGPMWFVPALLLMFACAPLLVPLGRNRTLLAWAIPLCILVLAMTSRPENDSNILLSFLHFLPVFIIGMFLCEHKDALKRVSVLTQWRVVLSASFAVLFALTVQYGHGFANMQKIVLFVLLYGYLDNLGAPEGWFTKSVSFVSDYSFPIYLIHGYFVAVMRMVLPMNTMDFVPGLLLAFVTAVIVTAASLAAAWMVKRIFKTHSRYMIGA